MKAPRMVWSLMILLLSLAICGLRTASAEEGATVCKVASLPSDIQDRIKKEFGSWKVQEPTNLSGAAHERWRAEKPLECPGSAVGQFENGTSPSYALLLVPRDDSKVGYKFLVFTTRTGQPPYEVRIVDESDSGAANCFIRRVPINKFFGKQSRTKFHVEASEGILFVEAGEKEYGTEVYFWTKAGYQHQPVDY